VISQSPDTIRRDHAATSVKAPVVGSAPVSDYIQPLIDLAPRLTSRRHKLPAVTQSSRCHPELTNNSHSCSPESLRLSASIIQVLSGSETVQGEAS
jgi:hypothetical protein